MFLLYILLKCLCTNVKDIFVVLVIFLASEKSRYLKGKMKRFETSTYLLTKYNINLRPPSKSWPGANASNVQIKKGFALLSVSDVSTILNISINRQM